MKPVLSSFLCIKDTNYVTNDEICTKKCDDSSCTLRTPVSHIGYLARKRLQQTVNRRKELLGY